jgi:hypothetical protein
LSHARRKPEPVVYRLGRWALSAAAIMLICVGAWQYLSRNRTAQIGPGPIARQGTLGVPESFVQDNADLFHNMPENIPANGPVKYIIRQPAGTATQPGVRVLNWNQLTPQQQDVVRRRAVIFLRLSPQQQAQLIRAHEQAMRSANLQHRRRMSWLRPVMESFTPEERAKLLHMTPAQRGEMFLRRRNELIRAGTLFPKRPANNTSPFLVTPLNPSSEP